MKLKLLTVFLFSLFINANSQVVFNKTDNLIHKKAFNEKISRDFSYLLLGENSPQQGISVTAAENGSNIKISGLLSNSRKGVYTLEADLAASNGVYFFDEQGGSESANITLNFFKSFKNKRGYFKRKPIDEVNAKLEILELIAKANTNYKALKELIKTNAPELLEEKKNDTIDDDVIKELKYLSKTYVNDQLVSSYEEIETGRVKNNIYKEYEKKSLYKTRFDGIKITKAKKTQKLSLNNSINYHLVIKEFIKTKNYILKKLEAEIIEAEIKNAENYWTFKRVCFFGISPFYRRESFDRFTPNSTNSFSNSTSNTKGDIYGVNASLNLNLEKHKLFNKLFIRLTAGAYRSSNISSFRNSTIETSEIIGTDNNGNNILKTQTTNAFIGDSSYEYGIGTNFSFDIYYYPRVDIPLGFFGSAGYQYINFSSDKTNVNDREIGSLRAGILFNLKNKEKGKPLATVQLFLDRADLSLQPNGNDNDLRFGLGVGLPINWK